MPAQRLITFTTDFGVNDHFVGTMKGVIYQINPAAQIVDICNGVNSFDILDGALTIANLAFSTIADRRRNDHAKG